MNPPATMDDRLLGKLARAEEDIVSAMLTGDSDLAAHGFAWSSLLDEISQASAARSVNDATLATADDLVARVATLVDCCLNLSSTPSPSFPTLDLKWDTPPSLDNSFVPEAHAWLRKNITNPYPSTEFKASLAERHNSPLSAISSWFTNARRRIGWTALCRDFFRNCRADAVDAAHCVLVKEDSDHRLGPEVAHAFVSMKVAAEELCGSPVQSAFTGGLDLLAKDRLSSRHEPRGSGKMGCSREPDHDAGTEPMKPSRISSPGAGQRSSTTSAKDSLGDGSVSHASQSIVRGDKNSAYATDSRKRRLSDPHPAEMPKKPRHTLPDPRTLSAAESEHSVDERLQANFGTLFALPLPAEVTEPDASIEWTVDLFNNYSLREDSTTLPIPDCGMSSSLDLTALDDLLQFFGNDELVVPPQIIHPITLAPTSCAVPQDLPALPYFSQSVDWTTLFSGSFDTTSDSIFSQPHVSSTYPEVDFSILQVPQALTTVVS